jgi:hypothetical protein
MDQKTPRRLAALIASAVLLASMTVATGAETTVAKSADPALATSGNAAGHMKGFGCGSPFGGPLAFRTVENNKNIKMVCRGEVDNPSGEAQRILGEDAGYGCYIPSPNGGGVTDEKWFAQMSASGRVTLVCKTKSTRAGFDARTAVRGYEK